MRGTACRHCGKDHENEQAPGEHPHALCVAAAREYARDGDYARKPVLYVVGAAKTQTEHDPAQEQSK